MNNIVIELKKLRERMRRVVGMTDFDIDLVTRAIEKIESSSEVEPAQWVV